MEPVTELKRLGFWVIRDNALAIDVAVPSTWRKVAVLLVKTEPVEFRIIKKMVHGMGLARFAKYLALRKELDRDIYLAFYERDSGKLLMQEIEELNLRRLPCRCAACRLGKFTECKMEAGGMVFFDRGMLLDSQSQHKKLVKTIESEQLNLFATENAQRTYLR